MRKYDRNMHRVVDPTQETGLRIPSRDPAQKAGLHIAGVECRKGQNHTARKNRRSCRGGEIFSDSGLKEAFYQDLNSASEDRQFIIIENVPPTPEIARSDQTIEFTGSLETGRFGLFPK